MSTVIETLIYDRTQSDVDRVFTLKNKILTQGLSSLTTEELTEYMVGMKGAYNYTDLNRVGQAISYLIERLKELAVYDTTIVPKTDWAMGNVPTQSQISALLTNLTKLRGKLSLPDDAPTVPTSLDSMTYETANDIEELLAVIDDRINRATAAFAYAGISYCGE